MADKHGAEWSEHERYLIDSILNYLGKYHDSGELYNILHGDLEMSHEDIELLGFNLADCYEEQETASAVPDEATQKQCAGEFAQAKELIQAAGVLIASGSQFAGIASFLCYQSAYQMMCAFIDLRDLEILDTTGFTQDYWDTCVEAAPGLTQVDEPVERLLKLETASWMSGDLCMPHTADSALRAISYVQRLELALLEAEPLLKLRETEPLESAPEQGLRQGMGK